MEVFSQHGRAAHGKANGDWGGIRWTGIKERAQSTLSSKSLNSLLVTGMIPILPSCICCD